MEKEKQLEFGPEHGFPEKKPEEVMPPESKKEDAEFFELYKDSVISHKLTTRREQNKTPFVIFSDIDRTFYHEDALQEMENLGRGLENANMGLVLVTGRRDTNRNLGNIPVPDILIQAAGSEIYVRTKQGLVLDEEFAKKISMGWEREKILEHLNVFFTKGKWRERVKLPEQDSKWELASFFTGTETEVKSYTKELEEYLLELLPDSNLKVTYWENHNPKPGSFNFFVGILPKNAGKVEAIKHLQESLNIKDGVVAGDSRIDTDMLLHSGFPAIIVGEWRLSLVKETLRSSSPTLFRRIRELPEGQWAYISNRSDKMTKGSGGIISALKTGLFTKEDVFEDLVKKL